MSNTKRRGAGEGLIRQRADGRWEGRIDLGWTANGRQRRSVYGRTRQEVVAKLRAAKTRDEQGLPAVNERKSVAGFLRHWIDTAEPRLRPSTALRYRSIVEKQLIPSLGHIRLSRLQPADVASMLARLQRDGLSPRTASHCRAVLRAALTDGLDWGDVARNVAQGAKPPHVPKTPPMKLRPVEVQRVLAAVRESSIDNLVTLALFTGLRQGELLGLSWQDVDFTTGELSVRHSLQRLGRLSKLVEPKSESSHRTLRLPSQAVDALASERKRQLEAQLAAGPRWRPVIKGLVFTDPHGQPLVGSTVTHALQRALRAADVPRLRFHHLRHLYGSLMLAAGVDLATVSNLLGHSSVALTASTYVGILPEVRDDAAERLEGLLAEPVGPGAAATTD